MEIKVSPSIMCCKIEEYKSRISEKERKLKEITQKEKNNKMSKIDVEYGRTIYL